MAAGTGLEVAITRTAGPFRLDVAFSASPGITVLFGHSGSGKSMTLRSIAGLHRPSSGRIAFDGAPLFDAERGIDIAPHRRGMGVVLQENALFPHLTARENVMFGLQGLDRRARERRAEELLDLLGLSAFAGRRPRSLSGGQQQRVALARALAPDVRVLLLDEPFSALDESLRHGLREELLRLRRELGLTVLFVTHDLREAHLLADSLCVFDNGRILQQAAAATVFRRPASRRVAELTGATNTWPGRVVRREPGGLLVVEVAGLQVHCGSMAEGVAPAPGDAVDVAIRPERVIMRRVAPVAAPANGFGATLREDLGFGSSHVLRLAPEGPGPLLEVEVAARPYDVLRVAEGGSWAIELPPEDLHVMPLVG